ncbi:hypothetical protein GCM10022224_015670 [Nonomuraea antimicrobica]|uniref:Uncharacterized protein n=1 Tax=Nonomuraea antimicrobica TaxID=561173 RepID=A0ABP7BBH8_9ACTN
MYDEYLDGKQSWSTGWRGAAFSSEYLLPLTADELGELVQELNDLVVRWRRRGEAAREAGDTAGRENVAVHAYGFPFRT